MNTALETLYNRRSIRKYKSGQIGEEELEQILKAAVCAPTGMNWQSPTIIAIQNKSEIERMSALIKKQRGTEADPFYGAPTVIAVVAKAESPFAVQDGSLAMGNLMNAAEALGLGSCWINRAKDMFAAEEGKAMLREWGVEEECIGVGFCIVGYKDEQPEIKPRKENYIYRVK